VAARYQNILLTGGTGFVGPLLARAVADAWPDANRRLLVREGEASCSPDWSPVTGDLCDPASIERAIAHTRPDLVLHLAAQSSVAESINGAESTWNVNCLGTFHIAAALARHAPEATVFFVSSADVYGAAFAQSPVDERVAPQPLNAYARSKLAAEGLLADVLPKSARLICVRSFNHTGPRQDRRFVLPSFAAQIAAVEQGLQPPRIQVGNLDAQRDFLDVSDVIAAYMALLRHADCLPKRALYNVASGRAQTIRSLLDMMLALAKTPCEATIDSARLRPSDFPIAIGDATRLREATGWTPSRPFEATLKELLDFWRSGSLQGPKETQKPAALWALSDRR
jgi:GDP-4-dehydro-6-deoxy-D-mannose reductase